MTSSAWYEPGEGSRPALVIFGAGYTLYALDAATGAVFWRHDYTGRPGQPPDPEKDGTRIFSSPVVVGNDVLFATDADGEPGYRGYIAAADLETGDPVWEFQDDTGPSGTPEDNGCGNVWSSGTVLPALGLVVFGTADCDFENTQALTESVLALHIATGKLAWVYRPDLPVLACDWDFGATANAGVTAGGVTTFLGEANKNGSYYSLDPATGKLRWTTNVVFGGFAGGFIATTAYDGNGCTDPPHSATTGNFEKDTQILCDPGNPKDPSLEQPTVHAFDAASGASPGRSSNAPSFAPTTVAGGMTFNGPALLGNVLQVRSTATGALLDTVPVPGPVWSGVATVGDALVVRASARRTRPARRASPWSHPGGGGRSCREGSARCPVTGPTGRGRSAGAPPVRRSGRSAPPVVCPARRTGGRRLRDRRGSAARSEPPSGRCWPGTCRASTAPTVSPRCP